MDMRRLAGPAEAQWYDPTNGRYTAVSATSLPNSGTRTFTAPATNAGGDPDWVLVLTAPGRPRRISQKPGPRTRSRSHARLRVRRGTETSIATGTKAGDAVGSARPLPGRPFSVTL